MHAIIRPFERVPVNVSDILKNYDLPHSNEFRLFTRASLANRWKNAHYGCTGLQHGNGTASAASYRWLKDVIKEAFEGFWYSEAIKRFIHLKLY